MHPRIAAWLKEPDTASAARVASIRLGAYFGVGDVILFGKYKNKKGLIVRFYNDDRGVPTVEVEPIPKGRKQNRQIGLFKIWHADMEKRAGRLLEFPSRQPRAPKHSITLGGTKYALSSDGGPLGDMLDEPWEEGHDGEGPKVIQAPVSSRPVPYRFLWAYDTERGDVGMWRVTDGNEKVYGGADNFRGKLVKLDGIGELNRVTTAEMRTIEREMRKKEDEHTRMLQDWVKDHEDDYQRFVNQVAQEVFDRDIAPAIERRLSELKKGVIPFGFKVIESILEHEDEQAQMRGHVISGETARFTPDLVEAEIRRRNVDPEAEGHDNQAAHWAIGDIVTEAWRRFKRASASRVADKILAPTPKTTKRAKTAGTVPMGPGGMSTLVPAFAPPIGMTTHDADGLPLRDSSRVLSHQPLYGVSYAAVPKSREGDVPQMIEFMDIALDPENRREIEMESARISEAQEWLAEKSRQATAELRMRTASTHDKQAAKFQNKKKVKTQDGDEVTVYEYSEGQVQHRNREKAKRVEQLRKGIGKLRTQVSKDLGSKDATKRLTALAVALIDETYERVGNDGSAKDGHFGVTGWTVEHISFSGSKATLKYTGKSGVDQKKTITDAKLVSALKAATKGKDKSETILCEGDDCRITATEVNAYLKDFDITAKDIRGLHANEEMKAELKKVRKGKLPEDKKEREAKLKEEFKQALEAAAAAVGHEASTLKSQYLVPGLEDAFMQDGTIPEKLDKTARQPPMGPNTPLLEDEGIKVKYRARSSSYGVALAVYYGRTKIGGMNAHPSHGIPDQCAGDVALLREKFPQVESGFRNPNMLSVYQAFLTDETKHGRGIGKAMYLALMSEWFKRVGPYLFMPMSCGFGSGTSPDAKRVWASLSRQFPSSGDVVAVLKRPALPAEIKVGHTKMAIIGLNNATDGQEDEPDLRGFEGLVSSLTLYELAVIQDMDIHNQPIIGEEGNRTLRGHKVEEDAVMELVGAGYLEERGNGTIHLSGLFQAKKRLYTATKTPAEKEDKATEDLIRPSPKKKPPRKDLHNRVIDTDDDNDGDAAQDRKDQSQNWKDGSVMAAWAALARRVAKGPMPGGEHKPNDTWQTDSGSWSAKNSEGDTQGGFDDEAAAKKWLSTGEGSESDDPEAQAQAEAEKAKAEKAKARAQAKATKTVNTLLDNENSELPGKMHGQLLKQFDKMNPAQQKEFMDGFATQTAEYSADPPMGASAVRDGRKALSVDTRKMSPADAGKAMADAHYAQQVTFNPLMLQGRDVSDDKDPSTEAEQAEEADDNLKRSLAAKEHFGAMKDEERASAIEQCDNALRDLDPESPRAMEITAIKNGIAMAAILKGEEPKGVDVPEQFAQLAIAMSRIGEENRLLGSISDFQTPEAQDAVRQALNTMTDRELADYIGGPDGDHPMAPLVEAMFATKADGSRVMSDADRAEFRQWIEDSIIEDIALLDPLVGDYLEANGQENTREARNKLIAEASAPAYKKADGALAAFASGDDSVEYAKGTDNEARDSTKALLAELGKEKREGVFGVLDKMDKAPDTETAAVARAVQQEGNTSAMSQRKIKPGDKKVVKRNPGDVWGDTGAYMAKTPEGNTVGPFADKEKADNWASGDVGDQLRRASLELQRTYDFSPWPKNIRV